MCVCVNNGRSLFACVAVLNGMSIAVGREGDTQYGVLISDTVRVCACNTHTHTHSRWITV